MTTTRLSHPIHRRKSLSRTGAAVVVLVMSALLSACGSNVKLDEVPVETRSPASVQPAGSASAGAASTSGSAASAVAPVTLAPAAATAGGPQAERLVYFDYDSFVIKPEFQSLVEAHAAYLRADRQRRLFIEGHTDERGGREYNLALGQKRSEAVRRALVLLGVNDGQVEAVSFGEEKPAATAQDEAGWARNRRAELVYR
jgi:peptidoglycan-associated lipoprotein